MPLVFSLMETNGLANKNSYRVACLGALSRDIKLLRNLFFSRNIANSHAEFTVQILNEFRDWNIHRFLHESNGRRPRSLFSQKMPDKYKYHQKFNIVS